MKGPVRSRVPELFRRNNQNNNINGMNAANHPSNVTGSGPPKSLNQLASSSSFDFPDSSSVRSNIPLITCAILASVTTGGTTYAFSLYGGALKHSLHLSQAQLSTISSTIFLAGLLSWIPGIIVDRFGERFSIIVGGSAGAASLVYFWAVATKIVIVPHYLIVATLSCLGIMMCLAVALVTGSVFKSIASTCSPNSKGAVVGAAKGYVGLGAGAYAILFESLGRENALDCLLMIAVLNILATTLPALVLLPPKASDDRTVDDLDSAHFRTIYSGQIGLSILVVGQSLVSLYQDEEGEEEPDYILFFLLWIVWIGPIWSLLIHPRFVSSAVKSMIQTLPGTDEEIPLKTNATSKQAIEAAPQSVGNTTVEPYHTIVKETDKKTDDISPEEAKLVVAPSSSAVLPLNKQYRLHEMLTTPEAWLLCWTCTILTGGGTLMTNNMGQMAESLSLHEHVTPAALAIFCAAQALSRVATGVISDFCMQQYDWPRPYFLILASVAAVAAHMVLASASNEFPFVAGVTLAGIAFGMVWPLVVLIVGELFGTKHLGANYMFYDGFDSAIGTLVISKMIAEDVYERHIEKGSDDNTCYGRSCFQVTHLIVAALSGICILTSFVLLRTKVARTAYYETKNKKSTAKLPLRKRNV